MKKTEQIRTPLTKVIRLSARLLLTTAIIGGAATTVAVSSGAIAKKANQPLEYVAADVTTVSTREISLESGYDVRRVFSGHVEAGTTARVAFEFAGRVLEVTVDEGEAVVAGQVLARMDTSLLMTERNRLLSAQDAIDAQVNLAQETVDRNRALVASGAISNVSLSEALSSLDQLTAQRGELTEQLNDIEIRLQKSTVVAPFDGMVAEKSIRTGEMVASGETVLSLLDLGSMRVRVGLPDRIDADALSEVTLKLTDMTYLSRLVSLRPDVDPVTRTRTALFDVAGADAAEGQTAQLIVQERFDAPGIWVPTSDLKESVRGQWTLRVVDEDDIVRAVAVEVMHADNDQVYVRGAFPPGVALINQGAQRITLGQRVRRVDAS